MNQILTRLKHTLNRPKQVKHKHYKVVSIFGRIGFLTKAFIYAFIGGLTLQSVFTSTIQNESPQGVFVLLGSTSQGTAQINLILILVGVLLYAIWRFWEGITGQGYDPTFSKKKNFFRYRVSPLASGSVYTIYAVYVFTLFLGSHMEKNSSDLRNEDRSCFPTCWKESIGGIFGLIILAIAFTIATITQLIPAFSGNFRNELDNKKFDTKFGKFVKYPLLVSGHIGFFGRALLFFLVSFLFWKILFGEEMFLDEKHATVAQAINSIRYTFFGKLVLTVLGLSLLVYGIFAVLCAYYKIFPTISPSENLTLVESEE